jgi:hypothetical protein
MSRKTSNASSDRSGHVPGIGPADRDAAQARRNVKRQRRPTARRDRASTADVDGDRQGAAAQLTLKATTPVLRVEVSPRELKVDEDQPRGRVATLIADGFFQTPRIGKEAYDYWRDRGFSSSSSRIYEALESLMKDGLPDPRRSARSISSTRT